MLSQYSRTFRFLSLAVFSVSVSAQDAEKISFIDHVRPIFETHCYECHSGTNVESGLRLDIRGRALAGGDQEVGIVPSKPDEGAMLRRVRSAGNDRMPPEGKRLTVEQIQVLETWITQGASWPRGIDAANDPYSLHWSWQPLTGTRLPDELPSGTGNEIDYFIQKKLHEKGIVPSGEAERATLIRRLFLDVLGLPPAPNEWKRWMTDSSPDWYSELVDSLLKSPHYGERWGRIWLDHARYADSDGYEKDRPRPQAYLYRDWVIDALNDDIPYDDFSISQLAGDLLPNATPRNISATGFHRNTLTNNEGGIDREEDRVKQTVDRLNTTFTVWMGLTVQCAQCHSHKYDPVSQREYYSLYSFFNDADETSVTLEPTDAQQEAYEQAQADHKTKLAQMRAQLAEIRQNIEANLATLSADLKKKYPAGKQDAPSEGLAAHFPLDGDASAAMVNRSSTDGKSMARFFGPGELSLTQGTVGEKKFAGAVSLDGSGQHLELQGVPEFTSGQSMTCSAWIRPTDNLGGILTKINEPNDFRGIDFTNNHGLLEIHLVDKWPTNAIKVTPASVRLKNDEWQHVLFTYDGSRKAAGVGIFVNGQKTELQVHVDNLTGEFTTADPWRVGRRKGGTFLKGSVDDVRIYDRVLNDAEVTLVAGDHEPLSRALQIIKTPLADRSPEQSAELMDFFTAADAAASSVDKEVRSLEGSPPKIKRDTAMALMKRAEPRETKVHIRGDFLNTGPAVSIGTPAFLPPLEFRGDRPDRLDLAKWMFHSKNSLTPRVFVNRVWQTYFGRGLVETDSDFGTQGSLPTHPELLDWLAEYLVDHGWSMKKLHRHILLSATYRQASNYRPELQDIDPNNTLLASQQRMRVSAETIRDLALSASGLLDTHMKGPSVFPPLPAGVIELAFVDVINRGPWKVSSGGDRYRRGVYTFFQRTSPYPMLALFDAPDSNVTCTRRENSNTPLQALTVWNDPVFLECSQNLALRVLADSDVESDEQRIRSAFIICFSRLPDEQEKQISVRLLQRSRQIYAADPDLAANVSEEISLPSGFNPAEYGAWVSLARAFMNLDEFITRQ